MQILMQKSISTPDILNKNTPLNTFFFSSNDAMGVSELYIAAKLFIYVYLQTIWPRNKFYFEIIEDNKLNNRL